MAAKGDFKWKEVIVWVLIIFIAPTIFQIFTEQMGNHNIEGVRNKMKKHLHKKYGEEFLVDRIGTRRSRDYVFYQARIYPKSILGTNKEWDDYYYASATVDKLSFGRLGAVGDSYSYVSRNIDMENYLLPYVKERFGKRVLLKVDVEHKVTGDGSWWAGYKSKSLKEMRRKVKNDPEHNRIELDLQVYVFNRIEDKEEKEQRRKDIFEFVQYLKEEGLFEYLELVIKIVDEKSLTTIYSKYRNKIRFSNKETTKINDVKVELPPKKLIKKMSRVLGKELKESKEEALIKNMNEIKKSELGIDGIEGYLEQYFIRIISIKMMQVQPYGEYEEEKERLEEHKYSKIDDIRLEKENLKYIYRHQGGLKNE